VFARGKESDAVCCLCVWPLPTTLTDARLDDMNKNCLVQFKTHWECLERGNQELWQCRGEEQALNKCVFQKLGMEKKIPDASGEEPVHLKKKPIYKPYFPSTVEQVERKQAEHGA